MPHFKQFDAALAKFQNCPLWPVRIIQIVKENRGKLAYLVFATDGMNSIDLPKQIYKLMTRTLLGICSLCAVTLKRLMVHLDIAEIRPDSAIRLEIPSVFVLGKLSSFPSTN